MSYCSYQNVSRWVVSLIEIVFEIAIAISIAIPIPNTFADT